MSKAKPEQKAQPDKYTETCIYTGRRPGKKGTLQRFERPDGTEMYFSGVKRVMIGHTYKCGKDCISGKPERTDAERVDNPEWDAADALVDARNAEKSAEKKLAASTKPALKAAIAALVPLCRGKGYFERKTLIEYLAVQAMKK